MATTMAITTTVVNLPHDTRRQLADELDDLRATYGSRWNRIPEGFGERAAHVRDALTAGFVPIDVDDADPVRLIQELGAFVRTTSETATELLAETRVLSEAFATDLSELPLRNLRQLCRGIRRLSSTPPAPLSWATPSGARGASAVLAALGEDLRALSSIRRELYEEFTEEVWTISGKRVRARHELTAVTRSGLPPSRPKDALALLRRGRELNAGIEAAWATVSDRLGHFVTAGIPDIDGATAALAGVCELHAALAGVLHVDRLRNLIAADAFVSPELTAPARSIASTIDAWESRAKTVNAVEPLSRSAEALWVWAIETEDIVAVLTSLKDVTAPLRARVRSVGQILDDVVRRDLVRLLDVTESA